MSKIFNKKDKKKKGKEKVVVDVKVDESSAIVTLTSPKAPEPEISDDTRELWGEGETDNRKHMVSLFNGFVKRGYTVDADWEHNPRTGIYEYIYKIKKAA